MLAFLSIYLFALAFLQIYLGMLTRSVPEKFRTTAAMAEYSYINLVLLAGLLINQVLNYSENVKSIVFAIVAMIYLQTIHLSQFYSVFLKIRNPIVIKKGTDGTTGKKDGSKGNPKGSGAKTSGVKVSGAKSSGLKVIDSQGGADASTNNKSVTGVKKVKALHVGEISDPAADLGSNPGSPSDKKIGFKDKVGDDSKIASHEIEVVTSACIKLEAGLFKNLTREYLVYHVKPGVMVFESMTDAGSMAAYSVPSEHTSLRYKDENSSLIEFVLSRKGKGVVCSVVLDFTPDSVDGKFWIKILKRLTQGKTPIEIKKKRSAKILKNKKPAKSSLKGKTEGGESQSMSESQR